MDRVTDEWLLRQFELAEVEGDKRCPDWDSWSAVVAATRLAFAQAVARECISLIPGGSICDPQVIADEIRARFGLED